MDLKNLSQKAEKVSQKYAKTFGISRTPEWFILKLQEELGELVQAHLSLTGQSRSRDKTPEELKQKYAEELADVICQTLILAQNAEIDIDKAIKDKWLSRLK